MAKKHKNVNSKKKKHIRTKRAWITDIPVSFCIFFIIAGVIIGNAFVIGTWHFDKLIDISETIPIAAVFDSYAVHTSPRGTINGVALYFYDREMLYMDGACFNVDVENALEALHSGDKVDLLLHPNSDNIWQMRSEDTVVLSFDNAKSRMRAENIGFSVIGSFGYLCAALGAISLLVQLSERRRMKQSKK